jgi:hypothetical protein
MRGGWDPIPRERAEAILQGRLLWVGESFAGIPLAGVGRSRYGLRQAESQAWDIVDAVHLFYGRLENGLPDYGRDPFVSLEELRRQDPAARGREYVPPVGSVFLTPKAAFLKVDGIYVRISASSDELALRAARALHALG